MKAPLYEDPIWGGPSDPCVVPNKATGEWWMFYTQRRAAGYHCGVSCVHGTSIGIATSKNGEDWIYRGCAEGLEFEWGMNTYWAPEVIYAEGVYHMFVTRIQGVPTDWSGKAEIVHYTSSNLWKWKFCDILDLDSDRVIDAAVHRLPDGQYKIWYKDEMRGSHTCAAVSRNLKDWSLCGEEITDCPHEGADVFEFEGNIWMITDTWNGLGVYTSPDFAHWTRQEENILDTPGIRPGDGQIANHAHTLICEDKALIFYFVHPDFPPCLRTSPAFQPGYKENHTVIQCAELHVENGKLVCDRNETRDGSLFHLVPQKGCSDSIERRGKVIIWERRTEKPVTSMTMEAIFLEPCIHTMIPAVSYDGNPAGNDHEYKGYEKDGIPYTFASHRTAVPAGSASASAKHSFAMWGEGKCSVSIQPTKEGCIHKIIWPLQEGPEVLMSDGWGEAYKEEAVSASVFRVYICTGSGEDAAWKTMLYEAWEMNKKEHAKILDLAKESEPGKLFDSSTLWDASISYAKLLYTKENPDPQTGETFFGFAIGLKWDNKRKCWYKRRELRYEAAWCGQNISLAVSLLKHSLGTGDEEAYIMAKNVLHSWITIARSNTGMYLTHYGEEDPVDACNLGGYAVQLLEACRMLKKMGRSAEKEEKAAREITKFILSQQTERPLPFLWSQEGTVISREGFAGAFLIPALIEGYRYFSDPAMLDAAVRSFKYYIDDFRHKGYGTAAALDTGCIDKESAIPLLKAGVSLYELTKENQYLQAAEDAAWYLSTWQWHHTNPIPGGSGLSRLGYDTFGGTAVSVSHHHMDAYALCYVPELWRLGELTGEHQWKERARAIWCNGIQGVSDGSMTLYDGDVRPAGSSDEGYVHTNWGRVTEGEGLWNNAWETTRWLVAWPCAFRLEVMRRFK